MAVLNHGFPSPTGIVELYLPVPGDYEVPDFNLRIFSGLELEFINCGYLRRLLRNHYIDTVSSNPTITSNYDNPQNITYVYKHLYKRLDLVVQKEFTLFLKYITL